MLKPREADVPALFLVLVVLPVVIYIVLGRWSETTKRKERLDLLAQLAAEESFREEAMASVSAASVIPIIAPPKAALHECARCHAPAATRCSRCKSVRYCSGKCQIMHWRHIHKDECQPLDGNNPSSKLASAGMPAHASTLINGNVSQQITDGPTQQLPQESNHSDGYDDLMNVDASAVCSSSVTKASKMLKSGRRSTDERAARKSSREVHRKEDISGSKARLKQSGKAVLRNKSRDGDFVNPGDDTPMSYEFCTDSVSPGKTVSSEQPCLGLEDEFLDNQKFHEDGAVFNGDFEEGSPCPLPKTIPSGGLSRTKSVSRADNKMSKSSKSVARSSFEQSRSGKGHMPDDSTHCGSATSGMGFMKMMGLKKSSKVSRKDLLGVYADGYERGKMLFPYDEFMKFFQYDHFDLTPRGLSNCGNSCYANAVLQCLTCTKPLVVYLLNRTHSRSCCVKKWCLMCELEQHVAALRDGGGPLSPSRILSQMRNMNSSMGDGSQEDAHEFLRLLVASMQSICLEEAGGEKRVHPSLQETTFVQHTFGGRLRSKVECLECHHRSERCETIMDLTLEIFGWVESLQDALTQFTAWEDLDGENMYKCGRCASYVRARKKLSVDEAPNILTIVLKRFQEGSYGKINKCITFPEMLDMTPFMTGTYDIPPVYSLYAVVVHVDTLNASFSGHYVSYVKDLQGSWLRIDDSQVQPVPMGRVMSEGAYMLFYMRSFPRPLQHHHALASAKQGTSRSSHKSPRPKSGSLPPDGSRSSMVYNTQASDDTLGGSNPRIPPMMTGTHREFPDNASSSDWSLFTSSDDASFTTESTRDSFSIDACNPDPLATFFNSIYAPELSSQRTISCRMFSGSQPVTRYIQEENGYVESYEPYPPFNHFNFNEFNALSIDENVENHHDLGAYDGSYHGSWYRD